MQNQRKNGRPNAAVRLAGLFMVLFCVAAVLIPAKTLFTGDGFFADYIHFTESKKMYIEIAILAVLIFGGLALLKRGCSRLCWLTAVVLVFAWIHVVFLPMVVSAAYLISLLAIGRFLRKQVFFRGRIWETNEKWQSRRKREKEEEQEHWKRQNYQNHQEQNGEAGDWTKYFAFYVDFLFGASFAIVVYCLLSAFGIGKIAWMRLIVYALGAVALGFDFSSISRLCIMGWQKLSWMLDGRDKVSVHVIETEGVAGSGTSQEIPRRVRRAWTLTAGWCVLMILIQVGRLNIALDIDTLWYGVRSQYIVAGGTGLYENPGLVGMVYVYSKGFEVLTLPLCDLASHSYLTFFNLWLAVLGIGAMVWNAGLLTPGQTRRVEVRKLQELKEKKALGSGVLPGIMAAVLTISVPGIMNMALTAKADLITWLLQLIMLGCFFQYIHVYERQKKWAENRIQTGGQKRQPGIRRKRQPEVCRERNVSDGWMFLSGAAGSYLLSLTMKPTSLVFSTAVFGMMGLYLLWFWFHEHSAAADLFRSMVRLIGSLCLPFAALVGIWARTMKITGMPVTSVFTSIFALFGFQMKYPFATSELPQNYQEESTIHVLARRLWQMLMQPQGEDMGHVILAWGTSLMAVLIVLLVLYVILSGLEKHSKEEKSRIWTAAQVIFFPFVIVSLISLTMLYQIDGNYFILLYSMLILGACRAMAYFKKIGFAQVVSKCLAPLLVLNLVIMAISSWAWTAGFSEIHLINKGRVNHRAQEQMRMEEKGNTQIWQEVAQNPENRVIAFGTHPFCLQFPCNVESYKDITSPWGNVELVNSPEAFETYMAYAKTDYVYAEAGYLGPGSWEWSLDLLRDLIRRGSLTALFFENGNMLARVSDTAVPEEEAQKNLEMFEQEYLFYDSEAQ